MRHRRLGPLLAALTLLALLIGGCGSSSSGTASGPGGASSGPIPADQVLPLVTIHGVAAHVSTHAVPLATTAQQRAFLEQFPGAMVRPRVRAALRGPLEQGGAHLYGAVVASGCDVPPGVTATADGQGGVTIVAQEVASPLHECLIPVTTVALVSLPT
ncbi:MAG: hypothetical protein WAV00_15515 [Nocardioides sp.]